MAVTYYAGGGRYGEGDALPDGPAVAVCGFDELERVLAALSFPSLENSGIRDHRPTHFEAHGEYDMIVIEDTLSDPPPGGGDDAGWVVVLYTAAALIVAHRDNPDVLRLEGALRRGETRHTVDAALVRLLDILLSDDDDLLDDIEDELTALEARVMVDDPQDCTAEIVQHRKRLLLMNRYYNGMFRVLQSVEENQDGFLPKQSLRYIRMFAGRASRFADTVTSLRDYVSQVREAFQNQLDIGLNRTMRLFTVITAIFLPLTLLVGWYGMNLKMPELAYEITYPAIVVVSVVIVVVLLIYFKKKKWF